MRSLSAVPRPTTQPKRPKPSGSWSRTTTSWNPFWLLPGLLLLVLLGSQLREGTASGQDVSYTFFRKQLEAGNVDAVVVEGERLRAELAEPVAPENPPPGAETTVSVLETAYPPFGDDTLLSEIREADVTLTVRPDEVGTWWALLIGWGPFLFIIVFFVLLARRAQSAGRGLLSMGKSRARLYERKEERTTFDDVAGSEGAKRELQEIVEFLRNPMRVVRLGGEMPKGVLLVGPPGTGKTLLGRAVAGEAGVPFFSITGSDFMEMFVGVGASRVRELFADAKAQAPSIVFIDELDSVGRLRGAGLGGGHDEREQTLNQLLSEMDGFEANIGVVVIAATNRPDVLDPALLRPGRFDRRIVVDLPTLNNRVEILKVHSRNKPLGPDVDLKKVARATPGFSGADLRNLLNEAALLAARREASEISSVLIEAARDKVVMGLARENLSLSDEECELLAYHEAGHAVVAALRPHADPVHKVTIVPRARSMGHTEQLPERERVVYAKDYLLDRIAVMLGGRAAEELFQETATSGAESDLKQATSLARRMVLDWGMGGRLSGVAFGQDRGEVFLGRELGERRSYGEVTAREVDEEVRAILAEARALARDALERNEGAVARLVDALLEREEVAGDEILEILGLDREQAEAPESSEPCVHSGVPGG